MKENNWKKGDKFVKMLIKVKSYFKIIGDGGGGGRSGRGYRFASK